MKTDTQIKQDVSAELAWEPSVTAARIGVEVKDGVVTLSGHVASFSEKWDAERATQRVAGVKALAVEIEVVLPGISKRNDGDIAEAAENVLAWTTYAPSECIKVMVEGGWVTLSGEVDWEYQRRAAVKGVRHLMGVTGLSNQITIKPKASQDNVKASIESALMRRSLANAENITVEVDGDRVTLNGTVFSWSERDLAANSAWSAAGVRNVVNNITILH